MYLTLSISAFAAATIFTAQSEALLAYQVSLDPNYIAQLITVATIDNVLGSIVNWWFGRFAKNFKNSSWFPVSEDKLLHGEQYYSKCGRFSLLLSWVPFIGDPITIVVGILRESLWSFVNLFQSPNVLAISLFLAQCQLYLINLSKN